MAPEIAEDELLKIAQKRLIGEDRKPGEHVDPRAKWPPDQPRVEDPPDLAQRRLPPPVLVDKERNTGADTGVDHLLGDCQGRSHRLLADHRQPVVSHEVDHAAMRVDIGDNVDEVEPLASKELDRVIIDGGNTKASASASAFVRVRL